MDFSTVAETGRKHRVCCIPSSYSNNTKATVSVDTKHACRYLSAHHHIQNANNSSMVIQSGPHGLHAIAAQDIKAGSLIVQCLPLAHSILVPPGTLMEEVEGNDDCGKRRRCTRCFFQEGDEDSSGMRKKNFGRCSKCRLVYYCSRSCQVGYDL